MKVKIKKLVPEAIIPQYSKAGDAGLDLTSISLEIIDNEDYGYYKYKTGLAIEVPEGHVALIFPRSSICNTGMLLSNCVGVIDSGYRGEIECRFKYIKGTLSYKVGERVAQLIIIPYPKVEFEEVEELTASERGEGGYGSTNVKTEQ